MNVVGRVGSFISQGVYSVATPFHPFGGAVDAIVVQQQDGSYRSTPWYVRFGKFQGVLKGTEKFVRISVNGIEADFHMYLDNSGEAYFLNEVESGKGSEANGNLKDSDSVEGLSEDCSTDAKSVVGISRLEHSVSDSGVDRLREDCDSSVIGQLERVGSDVSRGYYDFENQLSSSDVSVELCEFGSNRYESLDSPRIAESQVSDSEVILVSVDGHILTAPILPSEQNIKDVQLSTPQFHLGPGEGTEEFNSEGDMWAAEYICKLNASASEVVPDDVSNANNDKSALVHQLEVCEDDGAHVCQSQEAQDIPGLEVDLAEQNDAEPTYDKRDSEGISGELEREDVFKSCLALSEFSEQANDVVLEEMGSVPGIQNSREFSDSLPAVDQTQHECLVEFPITCSSPPHSSGLIGIDKSPAPHVEVEEIEGTIAGAESRASDHYTVSLVEDNVCADSMSVHSVSDPKEPEQRDEEFFTYLLQVKSWTVVRKDLSLMISAVKVV